jgi:hypothetical protein
VAVSIVPLAMYGFERTVGLWSDVDPGSYAGFYDWVKGGWFGLELAGIVAGVLAVRKVRFSFVLLPVAICVWFLSMDLAPLLYPMWNVAFVLLGVFLRSRVLTGVAGLGITAWLIWLSDRVFHDSMVFPLVLVSIGIGVVVLGVVVKKKQKQIDAWVDSAVPSSLRALRPPS